MAEYETVTLDPGEQLQYDGGTLLENVIFDTSADDCALQINMSGSDWTMRNVAISGQIDTGDGQLGGPGGGYGQVFTGDEATDPNGEILIEDCYFGDGVFPDDGANTSLILSDADHAGHMIIRRCYIANWNSSALYIAGSARTDSDGQGGTYEVEDCAFHDNNIAGVRVGMDGSVVRNCVFWHEGTAPWNTFFQQPEGTKSVAGRAIWSSYGDESHVIDVIDCEIDVPEEDLCPPDYGPVDTCYTWAVNSANNDSHFYVEGGNLVGGTNDGVTVDSSVGNNPDLTIPAGVPLDAEGAASEGEVGSVADGSGSDDGGTTDPVSYDTVALTAGSSDVDYQFTFEGEDVQFGSQANTSEDDPLRDEIIDNGDGTYTITGHMGAGGTDSFELDTDGYLIDDQIPDSVSVEEGGTAVEVFELYQQHTLEITSDGSDVAYSFTYEGPGVDFGPNANTSSGDPLREELTESSDETWDATGHLGSGGTDDWYIYGDGYFSAFDNDNSVSLTYDGQSTTQSELQVQAVERTTTAYASTMQASSSLSATQGAVSRTITSYADRVVADSRQPRPHWTIEGDAIIELVEEVRRWSDMELTFRTDLETVRQDIRPLEKHAGKLESIFDSEGNLHTIDRSSGQNNTYTFHAPSERDDTRSWDEWVVEEIQEEAVDEAGEQYEVTLTIVPTENKYPQREYASWGDADPSEWRFLFDAGTVATDRVNHQMQGQGSGGSSQNSLELFVDGEEAACIEESARQLGAVAVTEVPDGDNFAEDNTPDDVNTVLVDPPAGKSEVFPAGLYIVEEWETTWIDDDYYTVGLNIHEDPLIEAEVDGFGVNFGVNFGVQYGHIDGGFGNDFGRYFGGDNY